MLALIIPIDHASDCDDALDALIQVRTRVSVQFHCQLCQASRLVPPINPDCQLARKEHQAIQIRFISYMSCIGYNLVNSKGKKWCLIGFRFSVSLLLICGFRKCNLQLQSLRGPSLRVQMTLGTWSRVRPMASHAIALFSHPCNKRVPLSLSYLCSGTNAVSLESPLQIVENISRMRQFTFFEDSPIRRPCVLGLHFIGIIQGVRQHKLLKFTSTH